MHALSAGIARKAKAAGNNLRLCNKKRGEENEKDI